MNVTHKLGATAVALAFAASAAHGQVPGTVVVASTGQAAPSGPGVDFAGFVFAPALNDAGQAAFLADLSGGGVSATSSTGIYRGDGATTVQIARAGQAIPSAAGVTFGGFVLGTALNDAGQVTFFSDLTGSGVDATNDRGLYRGDGTTTVQVVREGQGVPIGPGVFTNFSSSARLNDAGRLAFRATLGGSGVGASNAAGIYLGDGGALTQIVRDGQATPAGPGVTFAGLSSPALNNAGQVAFQTFLAGTDVDSSNDSGVYRGNGATTVQIAREGQAPPTGPGTFRNFSLPSLNGAGQTAFVGTLGGPGVDASNRSGLYLGDGGALTQIAREGQPAPAGPGVTFSDVSAFGVALNETGQVAFLGFLDGAGVDATNNSGLYLGDGAATVQIAREGQPAPAGPGNFAGFFRDPALNDEGRAAFAADLIGAGVDASNDLGLYLYDDGLGLLTVAREGDAFLGSTITALAFSNSEADEYSGFNDLGQIAYRYTLADSRGGVAVFTVPEPSSLAAMGLAAAAGLVRRRRC